MNSFITPSALLLAAGTANAADQPPDCSGAEYRQFDFWIGEFEVRTPDGQLAGHNVIEPIKTWATVFDDNYRPRK